MPERERISQLRFPYFLQSFCDNALKLVTVASIPIIIIIIIIIIIQHLILKVFEAAVPTEQEK
jgi:hypothetical protein